MKLESRRARVGMLIITGLLLAAIGLLVIATGGTRDGGSAIAGSSTSKAVTSSITGIDLQISVTPSSIMQGDEVQAMASIAIRGGPGPITISAIVPRRGSQEGTHEGSITVMLDRDAVYALDLPLGTVNYAPGTYTFVVTVQAGRLSVTKSATLIVTSPGRR